MGENSQFFIGLISGTSVDGIDAALVEFNNDKYTLVDAIDYEFENTLKTSIHALCQPGDNEIERMGAADNLIAKAFAEAALKLIKKNDLTPDQIVAIGSHGQTIRHRPETEQPFTLQIGDPNIIAYKTGITTVADFRRKDMAAGGQGAPLAPGFHRAILNNPNEDTMVLNLGGIANLTVLYQDGRSMGFDTGPANGLMDRWIERHQQKTFDQDGEWANTGKVVKPLLEKMLAHPYFQQPAPKSTGREAFHLAWLDSFSEVEDESPRDIQRTLLELTAQSVADCVNGLNENCKTLHVCGGGAYNSALMQRIGELVSPIKVITTSDAGIAPEWIEATAFAWLAKQTIGRKPGNIPSATGASSEKVLGGIYYPE